MLSNEQILHIWAKLFEYFNTIDHALENKMLKERKCVPWHWGNHKVLFIMCFERRLFDTCVLSACYMHSILLWFVLLWLYHHSDSCDYTAHMLQGHFIGTRAIIWLPQCQWIARKDMGINDQYSTTQKNTKEQETYAFYYDILCLCTYTNCLDMSPRSC